MGSDTESRAEGTLTYHHWGTGIVNGSGGDGPMIRAHPLDPNPSPINGNLDSLAGSARIRAPAIRESYLEGGASDARRERGAERYVEVGWDTALDLVASELARIIARHGNGALYAGSYGWASAGRFHHAQSQLKRFLNAVGGFVRSEGNYSYNAALVLMPHIVGNFREHVKQATRWRTVASDGDLVVMFGGIPLRNAQISGGGVARHVLRDDLVACARAGVEFVNFSPLKTDADHALGAEWLPPRPGSDTAIMMGLAHTLLTENLHDRAFLDRYTVGFERVAVYLTGAVDGVEKDADWAASQSGIDAGRLRDLARQMARRRTLVCTAVSLQRAEFGEQPLWMTVTLAAMLGHIGLPGGGYGIGYGADASIGTTDRPVRWPSFPQGDNAVKDFIPVAALSDMLLNPGGSYDYNGETRIYPDIRLVWWAGGNPFHHHQDLNRLRSAFQKPETVIVNEISWTATARHADIVLPVTSPLERLDFGAGNQDTAVVPMRPMMAPIGQARDEFDIYRDLAQRMGLGTVFCDGLTSRQWVERMWQRLRDETPPHGPKLPDFETFLSGDVVVLPDPEPEAVFLSEFRADPDKAPLPTPSGRIELFSDVIAGFGYRDCPGHAIWIPPREWLGTANGNAPLHLLSGQPGTRLHSQLDNGSFSLAGKVRGREPILINPDDAAARGIDDGDVVRVHNSRGECLAGAVLTGDIRPGVVFLWTGAWYDPDLDHPAHRDRHGNPNVLTHDRRTSRLSQGPAAHSALVEVERFDGPLPRVTAFDAPIVGRESAETPP